MDFSEIAAIFAIVSPIIWKVVDFFKYARARNVNATVTQLIVWIVGVALLFLLSRTEFAAALDVGGKHFDQVNGATVAFIGLAGGSLASAVYDYKKSRDNTDSAHTPDLVSDGVEDENLRTRTATVSR